jgi:cell fate (sporulation/competence/biofilm development) regulator YlbF (YheA/YmcA/DUF963 family)
MVGADTGLNGSSKVETIQERAREVGRLVAGTEEFRALKRANERLRDDRESVTLINRLEELEDQITSSLRAGREPSTELQEEFETLATELQQKTVYQGVVAAQANFERLMTRINEEIAKGIEAGEQSRIIFP